MTDIVFRSTRAAQPSRRRASAGGQHRAPAARISPEQTGEHAAQPATDDPRIGTWNLVVATQGGDVQAFADLYERYFDAVFRFVYFRVGNRILAEDLTSDTFERALKRIGSFTWQGRDFGAWLFTIARHLIADHFKAGRTRFERSCGELSDVDRPDDTLGGDPEKTVMGALRNADLRKAILELTEDQQDAVYYRYIQGLSVSETAQAMGKNDGAVKALTYRAINTLRKLLDDPEDEPPIPD